MGVYIKGMEMPDCCLDCPLYNGYGCKATLQMFHPTTNVAVRVEGCPLVKVKTPHGRLIDVDARSVENVGRLKEVIDIVAIDLMVENAPTVIDAEGESNGDQST